VVVVDISEKALKSGEARVKGKFGRGVRSGAFTKEEMDAMLANLTWTTNYVQLKDADFVIEAATEDVGIKRKIFAELEKFCPETAILASNSSHMEPEVIFEEITNKERCLVIHYFFPAERSIIVEIVPGKDTAPEVTDFLLNFYEQIGKAPIKVKSRYGYAIDPIFEGIFLAGALLVEKGIATVEQMDAMAQRALGLGVGPFTAMNLTGGNPITQHGVSEMHEKIMPWFHSPAILDNQVALDKPWKTSWKHEDVHYNESVYEKVADIIKSAYFGLVCEALDSGIVALGDLEMAVAEEWPGFKVPDVLVKQAESGEPWNIPMVFREDREDVAVVTIRRPSALNALNTTIMSQLKNVFSDIQRDDKIKGAILTGFGVKAFVSGADVHEIARMKSPKELEVFALNGHSVLNLIENLGKPVVCAMNGLAFGGGNELAMACTARIAKKGIKMLAGQPEPKLGLVPGYGGSQRLPRIIGLSAAWPILRTGNPISSEEALKLGLIQEEVEGDIKEAGIVYVKKLISGEVSVPVIQKNPLEIPDQLPEVDIGFLSKKTDEIMQRVILEGAKMRLEEGLKHEAQVLGELVETKDMRIGMETFRKFGPKKNAGFSNA
jgi:enoyl-CoA hydratase/3-hydroxyacyl-CoA dehydrogenase